MVHPEPSTSTAFAIPTASPPSGAPRVRFAPGARTAWHTHPRGHTLYITDGIGYVARRGGPTQQVRPGDVVYTEPGEEHWHGATPDRFMAHVAIQEADDHGEAVAWLDPSLASMTEPRRQRGSCRALRPLPNPALTCSCALPSRTGANA